MQELVGEYNKRVRSRKRAKWTKLCGTVIGTGLGASASATVWGAAALPIATHAAKAPVAAVTTVIADWVWPDHSPAGEQAAALLVEAARQLRS